MISGRPEFDDSCEPVCVVMISGCPEFDDSCEPVCVVLISGRPEFDDSCEPVCVVMISGCPADYGASGGCPDQPGAPARQHHPLHQSTRHEGHRQDMEVCS